MSDHPFFLEHLPSRAPRPRTTGLNMVRDNGRPVDELRQILASYGQLLDYMKFRQFLAWYLPLDQLREKLTACRDAGLKTFLGGTVLEAAHLHGETERVLDSMAAFGFSAVEISHSVVPLTPAQLSVVTRQSLDRGLEVLFEYGKKSQEEAFDPGEAAEDIRALIDAGATYVIIERGQLDAALGPDATATTAHRMSDLADLVGIDQLVFEAETLPHQGWLIQRFGDQVNLGPNIDPFHVPSKLEPMRHGIGRNVNWSLFDRLLAATDVDLPTLMDDEH